MSNDLDTMKPVIAASIQPEQMDRHAIMSRALRHGFTLRPQEGRDDDLNEYVYSFAREVFEAGRQAASDELRKERDALAAKLAELEGKVSDDISPEFTDNARSALMWVLWHHQGGSSPVGQPIRYALGMGRHDPMNEIQVQEAKRWAALTRSESHDFHKRHARPIPAEPVNARMLDLLREAEKCISAAVIIEQHAHDEPPYPVSEWDYEAYRLAGDICAAIAAAEARGVTGPKRLTDEEIMQAVRHISFNEMTAFNIARAIEAAVLGAQAPKNGD